MCGFLREGICRWSELSPGASLTKQIVLRIALPHISLLIVSFCYAFLGSTVFTALNYSEDSGDSDTVHAIIGAKLKLFNNLRRLYNENAGQSSEDRQLENFEYYPQHSLKIRFESNKFVQEFFQVFVEDLHSIFLHSPKSAAIVKNINGNKWFEPEAEVNLAWNFFFATTCLTSIGYGANAPNSFYGRFFCQIYLMFGIPLFLVTLADLAKFCTEAMNRLYTEYIKFKYQVKRWIKRRRRSVCDSLGLEFREREESDHINALIIAGGEEEIAEFLWTHLEKSQFIEVPFVLVYFVLLNYITLASYLIAHLEDWPLRDGFYFVMTSVLTIGFGDLMPRNDKFLLLTLMIILLGLIVTTTCIDIVGAYYIEKLHFFGRRLDTDDPLEWLKEVQQKRIEAMKREAMRRLFETVTALHHMRLPAFKKLSMDDLESEIHLPEPPDPPQGIVAFNARACSMCLKWEAPACLAEGKRFWYTLSYKTRTPQVKNHLTVIDFITRNRIEVTGLRSFTLYEFSVRVTTRFGTSKAVRCQEYTEPCTVPQLLKLTAVSCETATICWLAPLKNSATENYTLMYTQQPAPQFQYWHRYDVGRNKKFTITDLSPDTRYVACVVAQHNFGLAAMSRFLRFKTRSWWYEDEFVEELSPPICNPSESGGRFEFTHQLPKSNFLAPPNWRNRLPRPSLREPSLARVAIAADDTVSNGHKSSLNSGEYQDII